MTSVLGLLDRAPNGDDSDLRDIWIEDLERSLTTHAQQWLAAVGNPDEQSPLSEERAWVLLGWVEDVASLLVTSRRPALLEAAAFAMSLLEASPLDRRDVMVVAALIRRGSNLAALEFLPHVQSGCARAGALGEQCLQWLWWASDETPATHEEVRDGAGPRFRRTPPAIDIDRLEHWLKGTP